MSKLETIPKLMDLVKNPFLLTLCLEALPNVVQGKSDISRLRVTRVQLYDSFVLHWLEVNKRRLQRAKLGSTKSEIFEFLLDAGFEQSGIIYQMELASAMFHEQKGHPVVDYLPRRDKGTWKAQFFGPDSEKELLRNSSLLSRAGSHYRFVHRSILEYFFSCVFCGPRNSDNMSDLYGDYELNNAALSISDHPLSQYDLVQEPSIIRFLVERMYQNSNFKQKLLALVELSKVDKDAARAAANSMTILVKAGVQFNGQDLRGIKIPGANLSGGQFDYVQFQGADLKDVNLSKAWIRQADFNKTIMKGVNFGELPCMRLEQGISTCAYSSDGKTFAIGLRSSGIIIFDAANWNKIRTLEGHTGVTTSLAFSLCNGFLLSGSSDKTVRLWICATGLVKFILEEHTECVIKVAFSPCGKQVTSNTSDGTVKLWDIETRTTILILPALVIGIMYSPAGMCIASTDDDGVILVFDTHAGTTRLAVKSKDAYCLSYSPDGKWIVTGHGAGELQVWDSNTGKLGQRWVAHNGSISFLKYSPNGQWIATSSDDISIKLWDVQTGTLVSSFFSRSMYVRDFVFSLSSQEIALVGSDRTIHLWNLSTIDIDFIEENQDRMSHAQYSLDGQTVDIASISGNVRQYNSESGEWYRTIQCGDYRLMRIGLSLDGLRIITTDSNCLVHVWNLESGLEEFVLIGHRKEVNTIAFSPCGRWITTSSDEETIHLWDARSGTFVRELAACNDFIVNQQFSPNSQQIISADIHGTIRIWEVETGNNKEFYVGDKDCESNFNKVCFSPSGQYILENCSVDQAACIWDHSGSECLHTLRFNNIVYSFAWSHCGQWIAVGGRMSVYLWKCVSDNSTMKWTCVHTIHDFYGTILKISWRSNALEFVTTCDDLSIRVWKLVETLNVWSARLLWNFGTTAFAASGASFSNAIELSPVNRLLLEQHKRE